MMNMEEELDKLLEEENKLTKKKEEIKKASKAHRDCENKIKQLKIKK